MGTRVYEAAVTTIPPSAADRRHKAVITFHVLPTTASTDTVREVLPRALRPVLDAYLATAQARVGVPFTIAEPRAS